MVDSDSSYPTKKTWEGKLFVETGDWYDNAFLDEDVINLILAPYHGKQVRVTIEVLSSPTTKTEIEI